ncbi:MAG: hypothetical protein IT379_27140, partial [Deltaproteobacteria bacterium]|nr:hypothetical protein [Deltaproteobacteria bacterium]
SPRPTRRRPPRPPASPGEVRPSKRTRALGGELALVVATPLADPAEAARWRKQLARLERASAAEAEQLDERFEAVDEILADAVYLQGGFRDSPRSAPSRARCGPSDRA